MKTIKANKVRWAIGAGLLLVAAGSSFAVTMFTLPNVVRGVERSSLVDAPIATSPSARATAAALALVEKHDEATLEMAQELATAAVLDDPLEVSAIRSLSIIHAYRGDADKSLRLLEYGESLSRRDLMTELALALETQRTGDNGMAVRHYGHALATTRRGYDVIVAQMLTASEDPAFANALGIALKQQPNWRARFLPAFIARSEDPDALLTIASRMWSDGVAAEDRAQAVNLTNRLLRLGAQEQAARLIHMIRGDADTIVQNGDFEEADSKGLGWRLQSGASLSAMSVPAAEGRGRVLEVRSGSGHLGTVAQQTLALGAGEYALSARMSVKDQADKGMPQVSVQCADADEPLIALRRSDSSEAVSKDFTVPAECPVQYLDVRFGSSMFVTNSRATVDDIAIERR